MSSAKKDASDVFAMMLGPDVTQTQAKRAKHIGSNTINAWHTDSQEGQLAVDVAQTEKDIVVVSTLSGAVTEHLEVYIHDDLLTIRGDRTSPMRNVEGISYFHKECFWGSFSRTIVLPVHVYGDLAEAEYTNGVLTVTVPKREANRQIPITIIE